MGPPPNVIYVPVLLRKRAGLLPSPLCDPLKYCDGPLLLSEQEAEAEAAKGIDPSSSFTRSADGKLRALPPQFSQSTIPAV